MKPTSKDQDRFDELKTILDSLDAFLASHNEDQRAAVIAGKRALLDEDPQGALDWLAGPAVWGSSGTLWDLSFRSDSSVKGTPDHTFICLLSQLFHQLKKAGLKRPWFREVEELFRDALSPSP